MLQFALVYDYNERMADKKRKGRASARPLILDKPINVKISGQLHEKVMAKSARTGIAISFIVRKALESWVADAE
jgi:predicted HicB family RNase H-like nuclease